MLVVSIVFMDATNAFLAKQSRAFLARKLANDNRINDERLRKNDKRYALVVYKELHSECIS